MSKAQNKRDEAKVNFFLCLTATVFLYFVFEASEDRLGVAKAIALLGGSIFSGLTIINFFDMFRPSPPKDDK